MRTERQPIVSRSDAHPSLLYMDLDRTEYTALQVHTWYLSTPWQCTILYVGNTLRKYSINDRCESGFCLRGAEVP